MRYLGLLKWFDGEKGFGIIGTADIGDVFIHQNNFASRPDKLLKATALLFETQKDNRGISAINTEPPSSYEDFKIILSYLTKDPKIAIEIKVTRTNRWGNRYTRNEFKSYSLIDYSLHQLLRNKQATVIFEYFKIYYEEQHLLGGSEFATKYFVLTKEKINGLKPELNDFLLEEFESKNSKIENVNNLLISDIIDNSIRNYLINKLFVCYLNKADTQSLFEIWKRKTHLINSGSFNYLGIESYEEINYEFPREIFLKNYSILSSYDLKRILGQEKEIQLVTEIVKNKIIELEFVSKDSIDEMLRCIQVLSQSERVEELKESLIVKLLDLLSKCDFSDSSKNGIGKFKLFLDTLKNKSNNLNYEVAIEKFNDLVSEEIKFVLWQATRYFHPENEFFEHHILELSHTDFLIAPIDFHEKYFLDHLTQVEEFETFENFCELTFLVVETPYKSLQSIFPKLSLKYQAAYWLSFPRIVNNGEKFYEANYEISDIPYNSKNFISYLDKVEDLNELLLAYNLIHKIQNKHNSKTRNIYNNESFLKLGKLERLKLIEENIFKDYESSTNQLVDIFKEALYKCPDEGSLSLCKSFIPKFINGDIINVEELTEIVRNVKKDRKFEQTIFSFISECSTKVERVKLWLKGYINNIIFEEIIETFDNFKIDEQPFLLRKIFSLIQKGKIASIENCLNQLSTLTAIKKLNLDVKICLTVIDSIYKQTNYIGENILSEIVCQYLKENRSDLVKFNELFQKCKGRTWITHGDEIQRNWYLNIEGKEFPVVNDSVIVSGNYYSFNKENKTIEIEGESYLFKWSKKENNLFEKLYEIPNGVTFCDARKSQIDETLNINFYWCCNSKCYAPCQTDHIHLEWRKYSLRDFIKILKLPLEDDKYYRFMSLVNRANRMLNKLKCNSCGQVLRDAKTSEFAFYRVTTFHCTNIDCSKFHEVVYLNHCLNWKCLNVVDNRVSVTCPNGWYICDSCGNCCSQDQIEKRLNNLITNDAFNPINPRHLNLKYQVDNKLGHMEKEEKYNYKTGKKIDEK